ncbi:MAG: hypothetical protein E7233_03290 [Lachnospiraceae bacterium]|nr:hypothetical protein [Lachnospiraceae bacterium]
MIRNIKKIISLILACTLAAGLIGGLSACGSSSASSTISVYYTNSSHDDILAMDYAISDTAMDDLYTMITELFDQMFNKDYTADDLFSAKPDKVAILSYSVGSDKVLTVDFDGGYLEMTNVEEIILRAAIVLTVIQLNGINGVRFTVENEPIRYSDGTEIGTMTADDFVNILLTETGMLRQETDVLLYFANEAGTYLVPVRSHFVTSNNNTSMEEYIVTQLIKGPADYEGLYPTISDSVELISVVSSDNTCYVNFSESFLEQDNQPVSDELMIFSIVNSLCRLSYIDYVQFLIDGDPASRLHTITDISSPFSRDVSFETPDYYE